MAIKKEESTENVEATLTVEITKDCIYPRGSIQVLDKYNANHLIDYGYAKEISSGESGQENNYPETDQNEI